MENAGLKLRLHIALLAGLAVIPAMAQTAQLTGDILDSTGAVVPGAEVIVSQRLTLNVGLRYERAP